MPLFKCTSSKSTPRKAISYITDPNKAEFVSVRNLFEDEDYASQFNETTKRFGKCAGYDERKYYHIKLSCARQDNVSPQTAQKYAEEMAALLFYNHECVIATHTDTKTVHSHIIVNAVDSITGKKLHINSDEYGRMKDEANRIGKKYGFSELNWRKGAKHRRTSEEKHIILKCGTSWKEELREVIQEGITVSHSEKEFITYLQTNYGVEITRNGKDFSYLHPQKKKAIRGERLGTNYTKSEVLKRIGEQNYGPMQISKKLNAQKAISPVVWKKKVGWKYKLEKVDHPELWTVSAIRRILSNPIYLGNTVNFRTKKKSYKSHTGATLQPLISVGMLERLNGDEKGDAIVSVRGYEPIWTVFTPSYELKKVYFPEGKASIGKREAVLFEKEDYVFDIAGDGGRTLDDLVTNAMEELENAQTAELESDREKRIEELSKQWDDVEAELQRVVENICQYLDGKDEQALRRASYENKARLLLAITENYRKSIADEIRVAADKIQLELLPKMKQYQEQAKR
ncbi:MAG TPA: hypothetical protein DE061_04335 [Clostridiales bacterium]|nr:hypothetical protein [Clostridiales bacterium]